MIETSSFGRCGNWAHRPVTANGQPAVASYRRTTGGGPFQAWSINVFTLRGDGRIAAITSFLDTAEFAYFGLPTAVAG